MGTDNRGQTADPGLNRPDFLIFARCCRGRMSSLAGRVMLLGTGAVAGNTMWDKDAAAPLLDALARLFSFLPAGVVSGGGGGGGGAGGGDSARVDQLAADVRAMMMRQQGGTVVLTQGGSGTSRLLMITLPLGGAYLYFKGYRLGDLQWVSRASFARAVESIGQAQEALSASVATFREAVGKRLIEFQTEVELRFGDMQSSQARLEGQVEGVQGAVTSVEGRVSVVDERVQGLERKLDETQAQLAYTSRGIHLLCSVVSEGMGGGDRGGISGELEEFSRFNPLSGTPSRAALEEAPVMVNHDREGPQPPASPLAGSQAALNLFGHKPVLGQGTRSVV